MAILGIPNSGKSTLINKLVGHFVCPESQKANTTRQTARAILTKEETQVVFLDTPGVVSNETVTKFKLEDRLVTDPERSCQSADLLLVLQDVSNRYVRESLDKKVLRLLCLYHHRVPAVLVLNKIDTIPRSRRIYDLIRKLTCNRIDGDQGQVKISKHDSKRSVETYLKRKERQSSEKEDDAKDTEVDNILEISGNVSEMTEEKCAGLTAGLLGWPGFKDVFTVSALEGDGVTDLRDYLVDQALPGSWAFDQRLKTDDSPQVVVTNIVKSKLLAHLPHQVPYGLRPRIEMWEMDEAWGRLRIVASVEVTTRWQFKLVLGNRGSHIKKISKEVEDCLVDYFSHEVNFKLEVIPKFTATVNKPQELPKRRTDLFL